MPDVPPGPDPAPANHARHRRRRAQGRGLLAAVSLVLAAVLVVVALRSGPAATEATDGAPVGSTLERTLRDPSGAGVLRPAPGEPLVDRTELLPRGERRDPPVPGRELGRLVQLTDAHVRDTASPARAALLDRTGPPFADAFRPHEPLTTQVLAAATRAAASARPDLVLATGDLADSAQQNELAAATRLLGPASAPARQRRIRPFAATALQRAASADPFFYRPDVDPPRRPGLLARAVRPFVAPGLAAPVLAVPGNHDVLVGGEVAPTAATRAVATGDRRLVRPDPDLEVPREEALAQQTVDRLLAGGTLPGETVPIRPDATRRHLGSDEVVAGLRDAGLVPAAGGMDRGGRARPEGRRPVRRTGGPDPARADAVVDVGAGLRVVSLDVTSRAAAAAPASTPAQAALLQGALATAGERWVVLATHEPVERLDPADPVRAQLARAPRLLATLAGDVHRDRIEPVRTPAGGYWQITTSSLADWPQQARALSVRATADGGAVLETWKLDTPADPLADVARELAFLDAQGGRPQGDDGRRVDRNVRLHRPPPPG